MARKPRGLLDPSKQTKTGQIKPGQTLNPKGRPRGSGGRSGIMFKILNELIPVEMGGRKKKIPAGEAAIRKLVQSALTGDQSAIKIVLREWNDLEARLEAQDAPTYAFSEVDETMIGEIYERMRACKERDSA